MTTRKQSFLAFWLGLAVGAVGGLAIGPLAHGKARRMCHLNIWQRALTKEWGQVGAAMLAARVQARFDELYAGRPRFAHRVLRKHLEKNILPGLALYQTLLEETGDRETAIAESETLFEATFGRFRSLMALFCRLPGAFTLFRWMAHRMMEREFPPQGWKKEWVEDGERCFAFNMRSCFYLEVLTAYGAPQLATLYCKMDDLLYESLPTTMRWERTKTLGRGDDCCDFCWRWKGKEHSQRVS